MVHEFVQHAHTLPILKEVGTPPMTGLLMSLLLAVHHPLPTLDTIPCHSMDLLPKRSFCPSSAMVVVLMAAAMVVAVVIVPQTLVIDTMIMALMINTMIMVFYGLAHCLPSPD